MATAAAPAPKPMDFKIFLKIDYFGIATVILTRK